VRVLPAALFICTCAIPRESAGASLYSACSFYAADPCRLLSSTSAYASHSHHCHATSVACLPHCQETLDKSRPPSLVDTSLLIDALLADCVGPFQFDLGHIWILHGSC
jgi:hypothetical protein